MMTKLTLSSIPNSFLSSLSKSFFARSAKNAERAALKVAFGLVVLFLKSVNKGLSCKDLFHNCQKYFFAFAK